MRSVIQSWMYWLGNVKFNSCIWWTSSRLLSYGDVDAFEVKNKIRTGMVLITIQQLLLTQTLHRWTEDLSLVLFRLGLSALCSLVCLFDTHYLDLQWINGHWDETKDNWRIILSKKQCHQVKQNKNNLYCFILFLVQLVVLHHATSIKTEIYQNRLKPSSRLKW